VTEVQASEARGNDPEELAAFFEEFEEQLVTAQTEILEIEANPDDKQYIQSVFRTIHGIKGIAAYFGMDGISAVSHRLEDVLDRIRKGQPMDSAAVSVVLEGVKLLSDMTIRVKTDPSKTAATPLDEEYLQRLGAFLDGWQDKGESRQSCEAVEKGAVNPSEGAVPSPAEAPPGDDGNCNAVKDQLRPDDLPADAPIGEILVATGKVSAEDVEKALSQQAQPLGAILVSTGKVSREDVSQALSLQSSQRKKAPAESKTVRVMQRSLDEFAETIGELLVQTDGLRRMVAFYRRDGHVVMPSREILSQTRGLGELVSSLDIRLTTLRRVPIQGLFRKMRLLVRELSNRLGKEITCEMSGSATSLDKTVLDDMEAPLVHLVRNSADHGIEPPDVRRKMNKKPSGIIRLSAEVQHGTILVRVEDDGAGIDPEAIRGAAAGKGYLTQAQAAAMDEGQLINLIFEPGFSLAGKVSDVSGRGVGMDAVMNFVKRHGGNVEAASQVNVGSVITLTIPVSDTLITKDAIVVSTQGQLFAIPTGLVLEILDGGRIGKGSEKNGFITWRGHVVGLLHLADALGAKAETVQGRRDTLVVKTSAGQAALVVGEVVAQQKLVCSQLSWSFVEDVAIIDGTAVMGDGRIAFILDVDALVAHLMQDRA